MADLNNIIELVSAAIAEQVTARVLASVEPAVRKIAEGERLGWTEEELAAEFDIHKETLARTARRREIGFTYSIPPTKFAKDGRALNGKRFYLRHHVLNYLKKNEIPTKVADRGDLTIDNVYQIKQKAA
jgi:hypothetical protein